MDEFCRSQSSIVVRIRVGACVKHGCVNDGVGRLNFWSIIGSEIS